MYRLSRFGLGNAFFLIELLAQTSQVESQDRSENDGHARYTRINTERSGVFWTCVVGIQEWCLNLAHITETVGQGQCCSAFGRGTRKDV